MIYRFIAPESGLKWLGRDNNTWHAAAQILELHIPPPTGLTSEQSLSYHLGTRNFFAWVYRRPLVGQYLGEALVQLLDCMHQFRLPGIDNEMDLIDYIEDEGYLALKNNPCAAVAILYLAETSEFWEMYIDAFAHCVGMYSHLDSTPGYHLLSMNSKGLLSGTKADLDIRLTEASSRLNDFARTDLAGSYGFRISLHVDTFRDFLLSFYKEKFGKWPPPPGRTPYDKHVYFALKHDFECLRELLINEDVGPSDTGTHDSGLNVARVLKDYDHRRGFKTKKHPTPLIPAVIPRQATWRRLSGLGGKLRPDNRLLANASLARSYNAASSRVLGNDLVQAFRRFEEDVVTADKEASIIEGRKARWLVVYAVCQTLQQVTEAPEEVTDADGVDYHVAISTEGLPLWGEVGAEMGGKPSGTASPARSARGRAPMTHNRMRSSTTGSARNVARNTSPPKTHRPLNSSFRSLSLGGPAHMYGLGVAPSGSSHSSGSSRGYETGAHDVPTKYTPSLPDSVTTASSNDANHTPPSSPVPRPPPLEIPSKKGRSRHVIPMMPGPTKAPLSMSMARKARARPLSVELSGSESESPVDGPEYTVGYATIAETEREAMYGTRGGVRWT